MRVLGAGRRLFVAASAVAVCAGLLAPGAGAAPVVNGNFETGTLEGWQVHRVTESGNWFAYHESTDERPGTEPIADKRGDHPPQAPPQGIYAAIADELNPDTLILSQDVALAPGQSHRLSLLAYYSSSSPIAVPGSGTLSVDPEVLAGEANQQYRIDVIKPGAPLETVDPADILATVFRAVPGSPATMLPTRLSADLSPFAGQTVRLRFAVAAHEEVITAGLDDVSISSEAAGRNGGAAGRASEWFKLGKLKLNRKNGSASLPAQVFGAGVLAATDASKAKKRPKAIKPATVRVIKPGTATLQLRPTKPALKTLRQKHKLRVKVAVTFTPKGEQPVSTTVPVVLKLQPPARR